MFTRLYYMEKEQPGWSKARYFSSQISKQKISEPFGGSQSEKYCKAHSLPGYIFLRVMGLGQVQNF